MREKVTFIIGFLVIFPINANEYKLYNTPFIGIKAGLQVSHDYNYKYDSPDSGVYGLFGGIKFTNNFRWDIGYQKWSSLKAAPTQVNVDISLLENTLGYDWYLSNKIGIYSRLGFAYWILDKENSSRGYIDSIGLSPLGEIGFSYSISNNILANIGYQYIDSVGSNSTGKFDSSSLMFSINYSFNKTSNNITYEKYVKKEIVKDQFFKIRFDINEYKVNKNNKLLLRGVANLLKNNKRLTLNIIGHTDSSGNSFYNEKLSMRRAKSCATYFIKRGISFERISIEGKGEAEPMVDNDTKSNRSRNRRVSMILVENKGEFDELSY